MTDTKEKETWAKCQGNNYLPKTKEQDQAFIKLYADLGRKKNVQQTFMVHDMLIF